MSALLTLSVCILFSVGASVFLKLGAMELNETINFSSIIKNQMIWTGGFCYFLAFLGYIYLLRLIPLSLAQPVITAGVSVVSTLIAVMYIKESMSLINWSGLLLICSGIFLLFSGRI
jgi:multidrug transporter EmrE-like cation transporter